MCYVDVVDLPLIRANVSVCEKKQKIFRKHRALILDSRSLLIYKCLCTKINLWNKTTTQLLSLRLSLCVELLSIMALENSL